MRRLIPCLCTCWLLLAGCASVPPASVELSATIGRDLDSVHAANRALAQLHFDSLIERIDRFVDAEYRPFVLEHLLADLDLATELEAAGDDPDGLDLLDMLSIILEEASLRIEAFRAELHDPVQQQRRHTLAAIDRAFQQLQTANAVVTGHLASVRKVHDLQAEVLAAADLEGATAEWSRRLAEVSAQLGRVLDSARRTDAAMEELPGRLRQIVHPDPRHP